MLDDRCRKLLLILHYVSTKYSRAPSIDELVRLTGRTPGQIKMAMRVLAAELYIVWDPERPNQMQVVQGWERNPNNWWER